MKATILAAVAIVAILAVSASHADQLTPEHIKAACKAAIPQGKVYRECSYEDRMAAAQVKTDQVIAASYQKQYNDALDRYHMVGATYKDFSPGSQGRIDMCVQLTQLKVLSMQMKDAEKFKQWSKVFGLFCQ